MSSKHSAEFKAKIALEALHLSGSELDALAEKNGVDKSDIAQWVKALKSNASDLFSDNHDSHGHAPVAGEDVTITSDDEYFIANLAHGANDDRMDYKKLSFWTISGTAIVVILIVALIQFAQFAFYNAEQAASIGSVYADITELEATQNEKLNSFGVVNLEEGVYHIPIDSAIEMMANN